jgi:hypothetical protein
MTVEVELRCTWAGHEEEVPAVADLVLIRPCGHDRRTVPSCGACYTRFATAGRAGVATTCEVCGHKAPVEVYMVGARRLEDIARLLCSLEGHDLQTDAGDGLVCVRCERRWAPRDASR